MIIYYFLYLEKNSGLTLKYWRDGNQEMRADIPLINQSIRDKNLKWRDLVELYMNI